MNSKPALMSSSIVVAPIEAADGIARQGVQNRPPDEWAGVDLISLPRKNPERYEELYRQITRLAAEAVGRDELLLARVQYVGTADIH